MNIDNQNPDSAKVYDSFNQLNNKILIHYLILEFVSSNQENTYFDKLRKYCKKAGKRGRLSEYKLMYTTMKY